MCCKINGNGGFVLMNFLDILSLIFDILIIVGYWKLLGKIGQKKWWAFFPGFREWRIAEDIGQDTDGIFIIVATLMESAISICQIFAPENSDAAIVLSLTMLSTDLFDGLPSAYLFGFVPGIQG